jgi:hypothetical protein
MCAHSSDTLPNRPATIEQGRQGNQQIEFLHLRHRNASLSLETVQVIDVNRPQITEQATRIAKPIADSAAATVKMKKTKI